MRRKISLLKFAIISTFFIIIIGAILHFTYDWSNKNPIIGLFSAVNESIWEHLKILFIPMLITTIIGYFYFKKDNSNYLCAKTKGILLALAFIVIFHYTYSGVLGTRIAVLDIGSFIVAAIIEEYYTYKKIKSNNCCNNFLALVILLTLFLSFSVFTFYPPHIGIFKDPSTGSYGI